MGGSEGHPCQSDVGVGGLSPEEQRVLQTPLGGDDESEVHLFQWGDDGNEDDPFQGEQHALLNLLGEDEAFQSQWDKGGGNGGDDHLALGIASRGNPTSEEDVGIRFR